MADTFVIIESGREADFKTHLNSIFPDIPFTMEEEKDGVLPFLNVLVRRRDNGELTTSVLSFNSNHPQTHKRSCVKTLLIVETHYSTPEATSRDNSPLMATPTRSEKRLSEEDQQTQSRKDRAYGKLSPILPTSVKQSPSSSSPTESELPIVQQEHYAAD